MSTIQPAPHAIFETRDLTFAIDGRRLLNALSLRFDKGKVSGLIGHNGSGKSTLIKLLARQLKPESGEILFDGQSIDQFGARDFARKIAYLPQDVTAAHGMRVRELVACGRYAWHGPLGRFSAEDKAKVEEALEATHMTPMAERMVETLSGGERQRAWLAMLVAQDSQCLLLDEPTSALDIAHQVEVLSLVHRLAHEKGLSVIIVLHDINMAARFCDDLHALKAGTCIASGAASTLMQAETLKTIYGIDMDVTRHPQNHAPLAYVV